MKDTLVFDARNIQDGVFNSHEVEILTSQLELDIEDIRFISLVRGTVQLLRHSEDNIYVKAEVFTDVEMQCGRCLEPFEEDITATFELQFTPTNNPEEIQVKGTEDGECYYDGETFDISEGARQALVIQIPVWPLCTQTCEGLCYGCGVNLNEEHCICQNIDDIESEETPSVNSPFAVLPQLLETTKSENKSKSKNRKEIISKDGTSKT
jgi:uncharacterized protein